MENLGGGIGCGLGCLARAVVVGFGGEVYAAVDGSIREHSARLISLPSGKILKGVRGNLQDGFKDPVCRINWHLAMSL